MPNPSLLQFLKAMFAQFGKAEQPVSIRSLFLFLLKRDSGVAEARADLSLSLSLSLSSESSLPKK